MKLLVPVWKKVLVIFVCDGVFDGVLFNCILGWRGVRVCVWTGEWHGSIFDLA